MKKLVSLFIALNMLLSLTACGNNNLGSQKISEKEDNSAQENPGDSSECLGMFHNDGELLIIQKNGTLTVIEALKGSCVDGTYSEEGEQYHFIADNTSLEDAYGTFDGSSWTIDGTTYTATTETGFYACEDIGDGIIINNDGTFAAYMDFENKKGKVLGTYEREGCQWIFTSPGWETGYREGTFDGYQWIFDGTCYSNASISLERMLQSRYGIYIEGSGVRLLGAKVQDLSEFGFSTSIDYENITVSSGTVSELELYCQNAKAKIKTINPYENEVSLGECIVCSFYTEDSGGTFQLNSDGNHCGEENHDELLDYNVYEYDDDKLVYKTYLMTAIQIDIGSANDTKGKKIIDVTGNADVTLLFDGMTLKSFRFELSDVLYNGLKNNLDSDALDGMDAETLEGVIAVREDILTELIDAFSAANIEVNISDTSGEIVMDNAILFDVDSYNLSDEGKAYLDQFMKAYASVLLSEKFKDVVSEIRFEGHTDSNGGFGYNQTLSQKRADAVLNYSIESSQNGLSENEKQMLKNFAVAKGYSYTNLIYDKNGKEDEEASRRVAVKFLIDIK